MKEERSYKNKVNKELIKLYEEIDKHILDYIKIFMFGIIAPMCLVLLLNEGVVIWKVVNWISEKIDFWSNGKYIFSTILILVLVPLIYLIWFYYLTIKRALLKIHSNFLIPFNQSLGIYIAEYLIELNTSKEKKSKIELEQIFLYINQNVSKLPRILQWLSRKILDQIPLLDLVNSFKMEDVKDENIESMSEGISEKINNYELEFIESLIPSWTKFIIPVNILILFIYLKM